MESWAFLLVILAIALFGKNQSLVLAVLVVLGLKLIPNSQKMMQMIEANGMNLGVTIISIAILIPIATGRINFQDLINAFKTPAGYIAVFCGILVAVLSSKGVHLLSGSPEITVALVFGTIVGVVFFKGIAAGPVIASGMTYVILTVVMRFIEKV